MSLNMRSYKFESQARIHQKPLIIVILLIALPLHPILSLATNLCYFAPRSRTDRSSVQVTFFSNNRLLIFQVTFPLMDLLEAWGHLSKLVEHLVQILTCWTDEIESIDKVCSFLRLVCP